MTSQQRYTTFRHEARLLLGLRHRATLLGDGPGLVLLALLYTGLHSDSDGQGLLRALDRMSLLWVRQEETRVCRSPPVTETEARVDLLSHTEQYQALVRDFVTVIGRYRRYEYQCATPGLSTAYYLTYALRYKTQSLFLFETSVLDLVKRTAFQSTARWQLWLHQGVACLNCFASEAGQLSFCGGCRRVYYCSIECRNHDWPRHRHHCKYDK